MTKKKTPKPKKSEDLEGNDDDYDYIKVPPDGGYGWVVLVACFVSDYIDHHRHHLLRIAHQYDYRWISLCIWCNLR